MLHRDAGACIKLALCVRIVRAVIALSIASRAAGATHRLIYLPLVLAVTVSAGIHLLAVFVPVLQLQPVFRTMDLRPNEWLWLLALASSILPVVEIVKFIRRAVSTADVTSPVTVAKLT